VAQHALQRPQGGAVRKSNADHDCGIAFALGHWKEQIRRHQKNSCQRTQNLRWQPIGLQIQRLKIQGSARPMAISDKPSAHTSMGRFQAAQAQVLPPSLAQATTASFRSAATGLLALHCATTSRAQLSHWPHWVATPSSHWISSKPIPARAWRAISRSEIRRQTQTIMATIGRAVGGEAGLIINANRLH